MKKFMIVLFCICTLPMLLATNCDDKSPNDSDAKQRAEQERVLAEGTAQTGMPAIKNFRERKMLKDILELRDQEGIITYTYLVSEYDAKLVFFCDSLGYGIPYATQYTAPEKPMWDRGDRNGGNITLPQADPNGLFSPAAAEGTWIMCRDPGGKDTAVVYVEPRIVVSPFRLDAPPPKKDAVK
jgi:hypothetical protein